MHDYQPERTSESAANLGAVDTPYSSLGVRSELATEAARRASYRDNVRFVFDVTAELYYRYWGECFHFALFEEGEAEEDFESALERTHEEFFGAIHGAGAAHVLELGCGGGAFATWMASRTAGQVLGVDLSPRQLGRASARLADYHRKNLAFVEHDIMRIDELSGPAFDAAVCLDAACYLPDKAAALRGVASRLRPGARFLLVDWCAAEHVSPLQQELLLEPFYRLWGIPRMETVTAYRRAFAQAGFRSLVIEDLSQRAAPNWSRSYSAANRALAEVPDPGTLVGVAACAIRHGAMGVDLLKEQYRSVLLAKAAADSGILRYVSFLLERS